MWSSRFARLPIRYLGNEDCDISGYRFRRCQFGIRLAAIAGLRIAQKRVTFATNYLVFDVLLASTIGSLASGASWTWKGHSAYSSLGCQR
jgi:hypothetical protein